MFLGAVYDLNLYQQDTSYKLQATSTHSAGQDTWRHGDMETERTRGKGCGHGGTGRGITQVKERLINSEDLM